MLQEDYFTFYPDMNYFACVCFDCPVTVRFALNQTQWGNNFYESKLNLYTSEWFGNFIVLKVLMQFHLLTKVVFKSRKGERSVIAELAIIDTMRTNSPKLLDLLIFCIYSLNYSL